MLISQRNAKTAENVIARSSSDEAISKDKIATPSARNDRLEVFSSEKWKTKTEKRHFHLS
ncbi:MAG: hypothetical protein QMD07_02495 [Thermodesulfovibrionales bacterium]|nr:hypothetical protein [Thermodesulfovibrionales bacterium]